MFLLYRVLFCSFAKSSQFCKTFLGLISCKCCNIVFFLYLVYAVFIFPPCKCKYCHQKCCNQINVNKKIKNEKKAVSLTHLFNKKFKDKRKKDACKEFFFLFLTPIFTSFPRKRMSVILHI